MSRADGHRDKGYAKWWVWLAVVFAIAVGIIYLVPFVSPQPEEQLETAPASITEAKQMADNNSEQSKAQTGQPTENISIAEDSPSRGAEEAASPQ